MLIHSRKPTLAPSHKDADGNLVPLYLIEFPNWIYTTPIVVDNVLYVATNDELFAIRAAP